nr:DUF1934 domain-containing protein [Cohnella lubricantis]
MLSGPEGEAGAISYSGMLYPKAGAFYIKYEEADEERGRCRITFKWDTQGMTILRYGEVQGEQSFRLGLRTAGWHETPAGRFRLEMETHKLRLHAKEAGSLPFEIEWQYQLWVNEMSADRFDLRLRVWEEHDE